MEFGVAQISFVHPLALWPWTRSVSSNSEFTCNMGLMLHILQD